MIFQRVNRSDPEKIFVVVKNGSGATLTAGYPAFWDLEMTTPDGVQVTNSNCSTTGPACVAGIVDTDIANGGYGLLQVYGYRADVRVLSSASSSLKGDILTTTAAQNALTLAGTSGTAKAFGFICEAIATSSSSAYYTTADCFLRML